MLHGCTIHQPLPHMHGRSSSAGEGSYSGILPGITQPCTACRVTATPQARRRHSWPRIPRATATRSSPPGAPSASPGAILPACPPTCALPNCCVDLCQLSMQLPRLLGPTSSSSYAVHAVQLRPRHPGRHQRHARAVAVVPQPGAFLRSAFMTTRPLPLLPCNLAHVRSPQVSTALTLSFIAAWVVPAAQQLRVRGEIE